jgi:putative ABC transport system permease protein
MAIPLAYNLRNLAVRRTTTLMTAAAIGLTVAVLLASLSLVEGLRSAFEATGHPLNVLVTRKGSMSELTSIIGRSTFQDLKVRPGVGLASLEVVTGINLGGIDVTLRGVGPEGLAIREAVKLAEGRWFRPGQREVVVGKALAGRYATATPGRELVFGRGRWTVVGVMDGGRSAVNSEIFADLNQVAADYNRSDALSSVLIRAVDESAAQALINDLGSDRRFNLTAQTERSYYADQTKSAVPIQALGLFVAAIMAVGSAFAAMNTMFTAVAWRGPEIGTLRVLGFSRRGILFSFFLESLLLSAAGGAFGCLLVLPLNRITTGIGSMTTFTFFIFQLRVTPQMMVWGFVFALVVGGIGGYFPARAAARKDILAALRGV